MYIPSIVNVEKAHMGGYAVPAFNAEDLEMVQGILEACEEMRSPVIIQTTPSTLKHFHTYEASALVRKLAERTDIPVSLHLDHGSSLDLVREALDEGYNSVMIDGSALSLRDNTALTKEAVSIAAPYGATVEGELGTIGGKEETSNVISYTDPDEAVLFAEETGVHMFAAAIGTVHGFYKGLPKLNFGLLREIRERIDVPLVLHGGSGIPDDMVKKTIELGIAKVNIATELRFEATKAVREALKDEKIMDPKKFMGPARKAVKEICIRKILLCGSEGKA
ncbi:MAG: class II fructose-bisphosphate aldolase [Clostridia bacterium]|nr:class II fructose-bisphosphate aldolase [Clostridia bacterium]